MGRVRKSSLLLGNKSDSGNRVEPSPTKNLGGSSTHELSTLTFVRTDLVYLPLMLLEPGFPADGAGRLLGAGIATLAQAAGHFARQEDWENGTVHATLLEPDPRQLSRGVDLRAAHIRQATGGPAWTISTRR